MSLQFVIGPSGAGKSYYIYNKIIGESLHNPKKNYILLVPEQYSMALQRKMVMLHPAGGTMNIDVIGFNRLAYRVFDELSIKPAKVLEDFGKTMLIRQVAGKISDKLSIYGGCLDKAGFIDEVKSLMSEMYQYDISRERLEAAIEKLENDASNKLLLNKLKDMLMIFRSFDEKIRDEYIVAEQITELLCRYIEESELIKNSVIIMDGFTGFTPIQLSLVEKLLKCALDVKVVLTIDYKHYIKKNMAEHELFYLTGHTMEELKKLADKLCVFVEEDVFISGENNSRWGGEDTNCELKFLENNLFRYPYEQYKEAVNDLSITMYENPRKEIIGVCQEIYELVMSGGFRYKDIAVISGDLEKTGTYVEQLFPLYGIPYFLDNSIPIKNNPFIDALEHALRIVEDDFSYDSVFAFLKSGVIEELDFDEIEILENYVLARGIRGYSWWKRKFNGDADASREFLMEIILPFYDELVKRECHICEYVGAIRMLMARLGYDKRMENGLYEKLNSLLDKMLEIMPDDTVTIKEFNELLDVGLKDLSLGIIPNTLDMVIVGDITRTRLDEIKVLFITGVNDGVIPKKKTSAQIISDREKEELEKYELILAPTDKMNAYTEQFYLYMNMTKPKDRLYLTYVQMNSDNEPMRPSYIISRIKNVFPMLKCKVDKDAGLKVAGDKSSIDNLILGLRRIIDGDNSHIDETLRLYKLYMQRGNKRELERIRKAMKYSNIPERLEEDVSDLIKLRLTYQSVSRLEQYAGCAYSYFLKYIIGIRERNINGIDNRNIGNVLHSAMEQLYRHVHDNLGNNWDDVDDDQRDELVTWFVNNAFNAEFEEQMLDDGRYIHLKETLERVGRRTAKVLADIGREDKLLPEYFEYKFSKRVPLDDKGNVMQLTGVVDRCDLYYSKESKRLSLRLIDYKSGNYDFKINELYEGLQLQLSVYVNIMKALVKEQYNDAEHIDIVTEGMYYYQMKDPFIEVSDEADLKNNRAKELKLKGLSNKDEETFNTITDFAMKKTRDIVGDILRGDISKNPIIKTDGSPCDYCAYTNVCRFDNRNGGNSYRYMKYKTKDSELVLEQMKQELGGESVGVDR